MRNFGKMKYFWLKLDWSQYCSLYPKRRSAKKWWNVFSKTTIILKRSIRNECRFQSICSRCPELDTNAATCLLCILWTSSNDAPAAPWNNALQVLNTKREIYLIEIWNWQRGNSASHNTFTTFFDFATTLKICEGLAGYSGWSSFSILNANVDGIEQGYVSTSQVDETAWIKSAL